MVSNWKIAFSLKATYLFDLCCRKNPVSQADDDKSKRQFFLLGSRDKKHQPFGVKKEEAVEQFIENWWRKRACCGLDYFSHSSSKGQTGPFRSKETQQKARKYRASGKTNWVVCLTSARAEETKCIPDSQKRQTPGFGRFVLPVGLTFFRNWKRREKGQQATELSQFVSPLLQQKKMLQKNSISHFF